MAQDREQYVQFTIKLLKGSFALNALWQDALNYHMIDQPEKLIALRLTEYYEMISRGAARPGPGPAMQPMQQIQAGPMPAPALPSPASHNGHNGHIPSTPASPSVYYTSDQQPTEAIRIPRLQRSQPLENQGQESSEPVSDIVSSASAQVVEQNADEAADYWAPL